MSLTKSGKAKTTKKSTKKADPVTITINGSRDFESIMEDMSALWETRNFAPMPGLLHELHLVGRRMSAALTDVSDYLTMEGQLQTLKGEFRKLQIEYKKLQTEATRAVNKKRDRLQPESKVGFNPSFLDTGNDGDATE